MYCNGLRKRSFSLDWNVPVVFLSWWTTVSFSMPLLDVGFEWELPGCSHSPKSKTKKESRFCRKIKSHGLSEMSESWNIYTVYIRALAKNVRLWYMHSPGTLRSVEWWFHTDVSRQFYGSLLQGSRYLLGLPDHWRWGANICPEASVRNYQSTPHNIGRRGQISSTSRQKLWITQCYVTFTWEYAILWHFFKNQT